MQNIASDEHGDEEGDVGVADKVDDGVDRALMTNSEKMAAKTMRTMGNMTSRKAFSAEGLVGSGARRSSSSTISFIASRARCFSSFELTRFAYTQPTRRLAGRQTMMPQMMNQPTFAPIWPATARGPGVGATQLWVSIRPVKMAMT